MTAGVAKKFVYDCLSFSQRDGANGPKFCIFHAPAEEVLQWADIERLGPGVKGVQRRENAAKRKQIAQFMRDKNNTIPSAIILALDSQTVSPTTRGRASITISVAKSTQKPGLVIDGQHRLLGISDFSGDIHVPIVAFLDANDLEKAFQFLVINNKGSKVSPTHLKALALQHDPNKLATRLESARITIDQDRLSQLDILNKDKKGPFFQRVAFPTSKGTQKKIVPEAFERALQFIEEMRLRKLDDGDLQRDFFATIWASALKAWPNMFGSDCKLTEKVGVICFTQYLVQQLAARADIDELDFDVTDFDGVSAEVTKLLARQTISFWTSEWKGSGYDTSIGHVKVVEAIKQVGRNLKEGVEWHRDVDIVKSPG